MKYIHVGLIWNFIAGANGLTVVFPSPRWNTISNLPGTRGHWERFSRKWSYRIRSSRSICKFANRLSNVPLLPSKMPILGYERQKQQQYLSDAVEKSKGDDASDLDLKNKNQMIVTGYMYDSKKPLQCRRTLHQYYYPMFKNTEDKDRNQVSVRWARKHRDEVDEDYYPIIMVDQLWLWVLHDGNSIRFCCRLSWCSFRYGHLQFSRSMGLRWKFRRSHDTLVQA